MSEKFSNGIGAMSALAAEMRGAIIELAGNPAVFDTRDRWLEKAARAAGISRRMAKSFFYSERTNPSAEVVESVRAALRNLRTKNEDYLDVANEARLEYREMLARIERLETALRLQGEVVSGAENTTPRDNRGKVGGVVGCVKKRKDHA